MIQLLIADDHQILLDGFKSIFDNIDDIEVVGTANNGQEVLDFVAQQVVDVILLDINMPVLNGVETCKRLTKLYPSIHVIALSMYDQQSYFKRMIQYGACGYLLKNDNIDEIEKAIRTVMSGEKYISSQLQEQFASIDFLAKTSRDNYSAALSPRELDVLKLVAEGFTDPKIAEQLFISHHTVNSHRKKMLSKFNAKNTAELVKISMERGII